MIFFSNESRAELLGIDSIKNIMQFCCPIWWWLSKEKPLLEYIILFFIDFSAFFLFQSNIKKSIFRNSLRELRKKKPNGSKIYCMFLFYCDVKIAFIRTFLMLWILGNL